MERIVIVGAGYGGVMAAKRLEQAQKPFIIINKHSYHQFLTWLHEAAGGRNAVDDYKVELTEVFRDPGVTIIKDEITGVNRREKTLIGKGGLYSYDHAVLALGGAPEFFGIPGLSDHSLQLRSIETARQIRLHVQREFAAYKQVEDPRHLRIVVGGAGLTGIEFVGELLEWLPDLCKTLDIPHELCEVLNIEAAPTVLPALTPALQHKARQVLEDKGARIMTETKITRVERGRVFLVNGTAIEAGTIVWTGGVRAHPLLAQACLTCDNRGRARVNDNLQSIDDPSLFVIGDCACLLAAGKPLPPTAQMATQMGHTAGGNILALAHGLPMTSFRPKILGTLASLGKEEGVGTIGAWQTSGSAAGRAKDFTKVKYLYQLGGLRMVARTRKPLAKHTAWQV